MPAKVPDSLEGSLESSPEKDKDDTGARNRHSFFAS